MVGRKKTIKISTSSKQLTKLKEESDFYAVK